MDGVYAKEQRGDKSHVGILAKEVVFKHGINEQHTDHVKDHIVKMPEHTSFGQAIVIVPESVFINVFIGIPFTIEVIVPAVGRRQMSVGVFPYKFLFDGKTHNGKRAVTTPGQLRLGIHLFIETMVGIPFHDAVNATKTFHYILVFMDHDSVIECKFVFNGIDIKHKS